MSNKKKQSAPSENEQSCNICGSSNFTPGPFGRLSENGKLPACGKCGSLERQRINRQIFQTLPIGFLDWRRGLQFSPDPAIEEKWFKTYEVSVYGGQNSLDIQSIDRPENAYDFISFSHVLEFIPDDRKAFSELIRILSPRGILHACFSTPGIRDYTINFDQPTGAHQAWHLYGRDLVQHLRVVELGLIGMEIEQSDPCTGVKESSHLFVKEPDILIKLMQLYSLSPTATIRHIR